MMNTLASPFNLMVDAALLTIGVIFLLAIRHLIRDRRGKAHKRTDPRLITLSRDFGTARPNARLTHQSGRGREASIGAP
jgi:hypothetical protein